MDVIFVFLKNIILMNWKYIKILFTKKISYAIFFFFVFFITNHSTVRAETCETLSAFNKTEDGVSYRQIKLRWEVCDETIGYDLRYSSKEIIADENLGSEGVSTCAELLSRKNKICFSEATNYNMQNWTLPENGAVEQLIALEGPDPATTNPRPKYFFAMKRYTIDPNTKLPLYSSMSNVVSGEPNNDLATLKEIEITYQYNDDTKGNLSETIDMSIAESGQILDYSSNTKNSVRANDNSYRENRMFLRFPNIFGSQNLLTFKNTSQHYYLDQEQIPIFSSISHAFVLLSGDTNGNVDAFAIERPWLKSNNPTVSLIDVPGERGITWQRNKDFYTAQGEEEFWGQYGADCTLSELNAKTCDTIDRNEITEQNKTINLSSRRDWLDITNAVNQWANYQKNNYGILIRSNSFFGNIFSSRDSATTNHPLLSVTFKNSYFPALTPSTIDNLQITQGKKHGEIDLSWTTPKNTSNYIIKYSTTDPTSCGDAQKQFDCLTSIYPQTWQALSVGEKDTRTMILPSVSDDKDSSIIYYIGIQPFFREDGKLPVFASPTIINSISPNKDTRTLKNIELTFQQGDTKKDPEISKTLDTYLNGTTGQTSYNYGKSSQIWFSSSSNPKKLLIQFPNIIASDSTDEANHDPFNPANRGNEKLPQNFGIKNFINSASLWVTPSYSASYDNQQGEIFQIKKPWSEGDKDGANGAANWAYATDVDRWSNDGAANTITDATSTGITFPARVYGTLYPIDIMPAFLNWTQESKDPNYGVLFGGKNDNLGAFYSQNEATQSRRPVLVVNFINNPPPETIANLQTRNLEKEMEANTDRFDLFWTEPHENEEDASSGKIARFETRYSTNAPLGISDEDRETWWNSATFYSPTTFSRDGHPLSTWEAIEPGVIHTESLVGLKKETSYYVAIKTFDDLDNASQVSNIVEQATTHPPTVEWVSDEEYKNDPLCLSEYWGCGTYPNTGDIDTKFTYRALFTDEDETTPRGLGETNIVGPTDIPTWYPKKFQTLPYDPFDPLKNGVLADGEIGETQFTARELLGKEYNETTITEEMLYGKYWNSVFLGTGMPFDSRENWTALDSDSSDDQNNSPNYVLDFNGATVWTANQKNEELTLTMHSGNLNAVWITSSDDSLEFSQIDLGYFNSSGTLVWVPMCQEGNNCKVNTKIETSPIGGIEKIKITGANKNQWAISEIYSYAAAAETATIIEHGPEITQPETPQPTSSPKITCVVKNKEECESLSDPFFEIFRLDETLYIAGKNNTENPLNETHLLWWLTDIEDNIINLTSAIPTNEMCVSGESIVCDGTKNEEISFSLSKYFSQLSPGKTYTIHLCASEEIPQDLHSPFSSCESETDIRTFQIQYPLPKIREIHP